MRGVILAELLLPILFGGLLGYVAGVSELRGFEELVGNARERINHLAYFRVIPPLAMFKACNISSTFYKEAVQAYILGMPNSSVVMSLKTLELGLKCKLGKKDARLVDLINEIEEKYRYKDLAHGFRILRNLIVHKEAECREQDALEALRHVSEILNRLFPFEGVYHTITCNTCKTSYKIEVKKNESFLGNVIRTQCPNCGTVNTTVIGTEWGVPQIR